MSHMTYFIDQDIEKVERELSDAAIRWSCAIERTDYRDAGDQMERIRQAAHQIRLLMQQRIESRYLNQSSQEGK